MNINISIASSVEVSHVAEAPFFCHLLIEGLKAQPAVSKYFPASLKIQMVADWNSLDSQELQYLQSTLWFCETTDSGPASAQLGEAVKSSEPEAIQRDDSLLAESPPTFQKPVAFKRFLCLFFL